MNNLRFNQYSGKSAPLHRDALVCDETLSFEVVAEEVLRRYAQRWKPSTSTVNQSYLRTQILPWFRGRSITSITRRDVEAWLVSLHATPAAADRSLPVLSVIMRQAELYGYRPPDTNPCSGVRRYRKSGRERFLTFEEFRRLGKVLAQREAIAPLPAAVVRLLLLTGCRQSEIRTLRWSEYREKHLFLSDSKTGPRTVWLSSVARRVLDGVPRTSSWVFPSSKRDSPLSTEALYGWWRSARVAAELPDVRLHDLRHSYASFALRQGETVLTIGRLLGHRDPATTLKYTHFADALAHQAVARVAAALAG